MSISLSEHINNMKKIKQELLDADKPVFLASNSALAQFSERVFTNGQSTSGTTFNYNSTDALYVNPKKTFCNTSALKPPRGKTGKTKFKNGNEHKTTWVESYKKLKELVGRDGSKVNFVAFGDLKSDIENRNTLTTRKVANAEYKISSEFPENQGKLRGLMNKYKSVFQLSQKEEEIYKKAFDFEYLKLIRQKLND